MQCERQHCLAETENYLTQANSLLFLILKCSLLPLCQKNPSYSNQEVPTRSLSKIIFLSDLLQSRFLVIYGLVKKRTQIFPNVYFQELYMEPN